jgi:hypothetical protein
LQVVEKGNKGGRVARTNRGLPRPRHGVPRQGSTGIFQQPDGSRLQGSGAIRGLENGAWVGNSASQLFNDYETENAKWKDRLEEMRILADRKNMEIEQWVEAASKLG